MRMRIFVAFIVIFVINLINAKIFESDEHQRHARQLNENQFISVKEGDVSAYIARRKVGDDLIVGKYVDNWKNIYIPYFGKELVFQDEIEILKTNGRHMWIPYPGHIPEKAIQGGYEGTAKLYIGRKWHEGKNLAGKIVEGINAIFCPFFGNELRFDENFDILVEY
ncbi:hypothetical protein PVAND_016819 [Polypedilum vanderplanki]|uniref:Uncharacterized protein n=1 Tax=Polypedilum vanderplanki TaxID=319348 RepID=A0A9J6BGS2_POLVA|nr:hypothetical protein PVAND_016819 [Polypedilum vanderplanki]